MIFDHHFAYIDHFLGPGVKNEFVGGFIDFGGSTNMVSYGLYDQLWVIRTLENVPGHSLSKIDPISSQWDPKIAKNRPFFTIFG